MLRNLRQFATLTNSKIGISHCGARIYIILTLLPVPTASRRSYRIATGTYTNKDFEAICD